LNEIVLDASVILKWFAPQTERHAAEARDLRARYRAGEVTVTVPPLVFLELLNVAGRRWGWDADALVDLAGALEDLDFDVDEAGLEPVAAWIARGLTAYDASYVALAEARGRPLITDDDAILSLATDVAQSLG